MLLKHVRHALEAGIAILFYGVFRLLPPGAASAAGGALGRTLGPLIPVSRRAARHIRLAMPELDETRVAEIVRGMWDNLGRVVAEYPHMERISRLGGRGRVEIANKHLLEPYRDGKRQYVLVATHLASWEVVAFVMRNAGVPYAQVYRAANNPIINRLIRKVRRMPPETQLPKGAAGARRMIEVMKSGGNIGMAVDQKLNDGIAVPFFGRPAMTPPSPARLALRFGCDILPVRMERLGGCHYRMTVYPPLERSAANDTDEAVLQTMTRINAMVEEWVRARPEQWLWLHRRWPRD